MQLIQSIRGADAVISVTDLKKNPMAIERHSDGAIAVLNRNKPAFYCVSPELWNNLMDIAEDARLAGIAREREGEESINVSIHDL